jgi:hypothetical protein
MKKFKLQSHFYSDQSYWKPINAQSFFHFNKKLQKGIIINKMVGRLVYISTQFIARSETTAKKAEIENYPPFRFQLQRKWETRSE